MTVREIQPAAVKRKREKEKLRKNKKNNKRERKAIPSAAATIKKEL